MTDEYISRKEALKAIYTSTAPALEIEAIPAADVVEVRHGRWQNPEDAECYQCSVCGKYRNQEYGLNAPIFDKFCPSCGAVMGGGQNDDC